jgi:hypothetical protein
VSLDSHVVPPPKGLLRRAGHSARARRHWLLCRHALRYGAGLPMQRRPVCGPGPKRFSGSRAGRARGRAARAGRAACSHSHGCTRSGSCRLGLHSIRVCGLRRAALHHRTSRHPKQGRSTHSSALRPPHKRLYSYSTCCCWHAAFPSRCRPCPRDAGPRHVPPLSGEPLPPSATPPNQAKPSARALVPSPLTPPPPLHPTPSLS